MAALSLKERQHQVREEAILDAARQLIAERGFNATSMDDLAAQVGISKATLYQHFKSKEELARDMVLRAVGQAHLYIASRDPALPAIERLRQIITWIVRERFGEPGLDFRDSEITVTPLLKTDAAYQEIKGQMVQQMRALIDSAKAENSINASLPTSILAQALLSLVEDGSYMDLLRSESCTIADLCDTFLAMISGAASLPSPAPASSV